MFIPGGKWKYAANGEQGELDIRFESGDRFAGSVEGRPIDGRWQAGSGGITFTTGGGTTRIYKGSLVFPRSDTPVHALYTLAGIYDDLSGTHAWFAQQSIVP